MKWERMDEGGQVLTFCRSRSSGSNAPDLRQNIFFTFALRSKCVELEIHNDKKKFSSETWWINSHNINKPEYMSLSFFRGFNLEV